MLAGDINHLNHVIPYMIGTLGLQDGVRSPVVISLSYLFTISVFDLIAP